MALEEDFQKAMHPGAARRSVEHPIGRQVPWKAEGLRMAPFGTFSALAAQTTSMTGPRDWLSQRIRRGLWPGTSKPQTSMRPRMSPFYSSL